MSEELKPCPFCGGEASIKIHDFFDDTRLYTPKCKCGAGIVEVFHTEAEAVAAWNTRANEPLGGVECYECQNGAPMVPYRTCRNTSDWMFECSVCGAEIVADSCGLFSPDMHVMVDGEECKVNYCPNCGAKVVDE